MKNPKYRVNKKNGGEVPVCEDARALYVPVGCGMCMECRKANAAQWKVRLLEEIRKDNECQFITLTLSDEWVMKIAEGHEERGKWVEGIPQEWQGYDLDNEIATRAMRGFLERWRRKTGKSLKHWCSTEIGGHGSENIHMHGIIWTKEISMVEERWKYGHVWSGEEKGASYVNDSTVGYITKYLNKIDINNKGYKSKVLTSAGIGSEYVKRTDSGKNKYKGKNTNESYKSRSGKKSALPIYYRNKIYSEEEREKLWMQKLDKEERYVGGERISIKNGEEEYKKAVAYYRKINKEFGYGGEELSEEEYKYEQARRNLIILTRIAKGNEKNNKNKKKD